jgi:hypothetical protein
VKLNSVTGSTGCAGLSLMGDGDPSKSASKSGATSDECGHYPRRLRKKQRKSVRFLPGMTLEG